MKDRTRLVTPDLLSLVITGLLLLSPGRGPFIPEMFSASRGTGHCDVLAPALSQEASIQNNQYAIEIHFSSILPGFSFPPIAPHWPKLPRTQLAKESRNIIFIVF